MKRILAQLVGGVVVMSLLSGCYSHNMATCNTYSEIKIEDKVRKDQNDDNKATDEIQRKIIRDANVSLTVENVDAVIDSLVKLAKDNGGYAQLTGETTIIRIESNHLDRVVREIGRFGKVTSQSVSARDITNQYYDLKSRIENTEKARLRYLELLKKATSVSDVLKIERELERVTGDLELMQANLERMKHLSQFATITIRVNPKVKLGLLGYMGVGAFKVVRWLFVRT